MNTIHLLTAILPGSGYVSVQVDAERPSKRQRLDANDLQARLQSTEVTPGSTADWTCNWIADPRPAFKAIMEAPGEFPSVIAALFVEYLQGTEDDSVFGVRKWEEIGCKISTAPPILPLSFEGIWQGACPGYPGKKVREACTLQLMPDKVNDQPLTLNEMESVSQNNRARYEHYYQNLKALIGNRALERPYWCVITTTLMPESTAKDDAEQQKLVPADWERSSALDTVVAVVTQLIKTRTCKLVDKARTSDRMNEGTASEARGLISKGRADSVVITCSHPTYKDRAIGMLIMRKIF